MKNIIIIYELLYFDITFLSYLQELCIRSIQYTNTQMVTFFLQDAAGGSLLEDLSEVDFPVLLQVDRILR